MADSQGQNQTNEANENQGAATNDASSPMPNMKGEAKAEPSGYRGNSPSTAGPGQTGIHSATPENAEGQLNPSSPADTGTTPGSNAPLG